MGTDLPPCLTDTTEPADAGEDELCLYCPTDAEAVICYALHGQQRYILTCDQCSDYAELRAHGLTDCDESVYLIPGTTVSP